MNIVFLTIGYPADINSRGIYTDLMTTFVKMGHNVTVFMQDENGDRVFSQSESGVNVYPVYTRRITKTNFIRKGINLLLLEKRFYNSVRRFCDGRIDLLLYSTPPITFCNAIKRIKEHYNCINYLLLKDIFPQNAVDLKILSRHSPLYYYFRRQEKKLYINSDFIGCMSPANVAYVKKHNRYLSETKIHLSPNCIIPTDNYENKEGSNHSELRLVYGGNLGKPQGIDYIVACCNIIEKIDNVYFTIIGSGTEFNKLGKAIMGLKKTKLIPYLPKQEYLECIKKHDMGMVFLDYSFTIPNYPSRILDYLDNGLPIFACTDENSDVKQEICDFGAGVWCKSNSVDNFEKTLKYLVNNISSIDIMRVKARSVLIQKYDVADEALNIIDRVEKYNLQKSLI